MDKDLVEFTISLPGRFKITPSVRKVLLREAYQDLWTEDIRSREKQGFGSPLKTWFQDKRFKQLKKDFLLDPQHSIYSFINFEVAEKYFSSDNNHTWILLNLSIWLENNKYISA